MNNIPEQIIKELILKGVNEFMYDSFDHKSTKAHLESMGVAPGKYDILYYTVGKELRQKFRIWRKGKIWDIAFNSDGTIKKIAVGSRDRYKKRFNPNHFGITIKPLIFESDDTYDLIKNGLACKQTL